MEKTERRGRPAESPSVVLDKFERTFYEVPTKPELGWKMTWHYDINKTDLSPAFNFDLFSKKLEL